MSCTRAPRAEYGTPGWAADYAEAKAEEALAHERCFNAHLERRCPGLRPTAKYLAGEDPPWHPRFYTRLDWLNFARAREMGKFGGPTRY